MKKLQLSGNLRLKVVILVICLAVAVIVIAGLNYAAVFQPSQKSVQAPINGVAVVNVCQQKCNQNYQLCQVNAGDNDAELKNCESINAKCIQACPPPSNY